MKVPGKLTRLLGTAAALGALAALVAQTPALAADAAKQTNSAKLAKPLKEAQDDLKAKKYSDAIAKLKAAEGIEGKTAYDQHLINDMIGFAYFKSNDLPDAAKAFEAELDDGYLTGPDVQQKTRAVAEIEYQGKDYDKAIEFGSRAIKGGFGDNEIQTLVGQSYYLKGDMKGTEKFEEQLVDNQIKAGEAPKNEALMLIYSACQKLNDKDCQTRTMERLVTYYPKPDYWKQLLFGLRQQTSSNDAQLFQTYRLMNEVDVLSDPGDYSEMAQIALDQGSPGDAVSVLQKGFEKSVFTDQRIKDKNQRLLDRAKQQSTTDQASLPKAERDAAAAATGAKSIGVGKAYLGYGQYDKAVDAFTRGLAKGGLTNQAEAQLDLGIAEFKAGRKDDAIKSFKAVKGDPVLERIASLWVLRARQGTASTAAPGSTTAVPHRGAHRHA
ncbi:MAG: tetratricopeptide repeat protein [Steroidobacteraceae bacterium]